MKKIENDKNVFDEIDRDIDQFKTAIKLSRLKKTLKIQMKILRGLIIFLFILSASFICLGIFNGQNIADIAMGIICLILAIQCLVFLKIISKSQPKKGEKR